MLSTGAVRAAFQAFRRRSSRRRRAGPWDRVARLVVPLVQTGRLPRLPGNALVWAGLGVFCAVNLFLLVRSYNGSIGSDYLFTYSAVVGAHLDGFNHLYDPISQQRGLPQGYLQADWAFRYPPIIAVLAWPLGSLSFWPGYFIWFAVELGGWIIAWRGPS